MGAIFLWRKVLAGFFTGLVVTVFFVADGLMGGDISVLVGGLFVMIFVLLVIGLYGVPVSVLADIIVPVNVKRMWLFSLLIHVGFVVVPLLIFKTIEPRINILSYIWLVTPIAIFFWVMDEVLKKWMPFLNRTPGRMVKVISGIVSASLILGSLSWFGFSDNGVLSGKPPLTKYYVPEDYRGWLYVYYDRPGKPALEEEGDFRVVRFDEEGAAWTSTEFKGAYVLENEYYFIFDEGVEKKIPRGMIHYGPMSGFSSTDLGDYTNIEQIFIGTEEAFNRNRDSDYTKFIPKPDPERADYEILIPEAYTGWVKIHTPPESNELPDQTIKVGENGEAVFPYEGITLQSEYDHFYYITESGKKRIPQEHISEIYNFPGLIVIYIGPRENDDPFPYHEYLKEKES